MSYNHAIKQYLDELQKRYTTGISREHSYRGDLQKLFETICPNIIATNEPARVVCGAPDYILTRNNVPVGYVEAKDLGADLKSKSYKEQFDRYRNGLPNLIITNYLDFEFYKDGELVSVITIGALEGDKVISIESNLQAFELFLIDFTNTISQTIKSSLKLAKMMAGKARLLADVIQRSIEYDEQQNEVNVLREENETLRSQLHAFKQILIHDIKPKQFADIYSQTIAYGMFAARLHDDTLADFSRQEAAQLIPKSNPFLRKLFQYISGYDIDPRIVWIVDSLADIFLATDVADLLRNFGASTQQTDPIIHFYETFLAEYDPKLRKARGVWYTPEPAVKFIVRAVDDILKSQFDLKDGLADTSRTKIKVKSQTPDARTKQGVKEAEVSVHKVQILDPATGTGTFLAEVVKLIYGKFKGQQGIWSKYVDDHLLPRLNGFELLMASYAMAHLKLDLLLKETGYSSKTDQRFRVYLTNSLEEHHPDTGTLFSNWLSTEANEANRIKRDTPVMCVIGNPPYAVSSTNKNVWIQDLISDYKKNLKERKINLDDDYIKFIRYGQYHIDKNGSGVLAYISNNSFIDGITHRQMRKHLLESFDEIYILDLHGNSRKLETSPDGTVDQNVFDIMAGVSINIFVKTGEKKKNELGKIYHSDLYGKRAKKYSFLNSNSIKTIAWRELECNEPNYFFVYKDYDLRSEYQKGFKIDELFILNSAGIETQKDKIAVHFNKESLKQTFDDFILLEENKLRQKYPQAKDTRDWKIQTAKEDLISHGEDAFQKIVYRPFDERYSYLSGKSKGFVAYPRFNVTRHLLFENLSLLTCKRQTSFDFQHIFVVNKPSERCTVSLQTGEVGYIFPLYLYPENNGQQTFEQSYERKPNLRPEIIKQIAEKLDLIFLEEKATTENSFAPIDILDYIYAVLHSPKYREKYLEFLKIDFPIVPYPKDKTIFWQLVKLGADLRQIHMMKSPKVEEYITQYPLDGSNIVGKPKYIDSKIYINETQYFDNVPKKAWEFYIGGYQPAQKWLKDRKERELSFEDILHYQKIIVALNETARLMNEINKIDFI